MFRLSRESRLAIAFLVATVVFRCWFLTTLDLIPDEAYYWLWSKHLASSYFSKGPGIAWTIAWGTWLFGDNSLGIRFLSVLLSAGTGWQLFVLGRRLFDARTGLAAMIVAAIVPIYAVGAILMTIDPLSVFFWVWAGNVFLDASEGDRPWHWALCGFAVGSGFLCKYVNLLELLGFVGYALSVSRYRRTLWSWRWGLLLGVTAVCTLPVIGWNDRNGWITASHLKHRGDLDAGFHLHPEHLLQFFVNQAIPISPLLLLGILIAAIAIFRRPSKTEAEKYLLALFLPTFGFYFLLSFNDPAKGNWLVTSYPAGILLAVSFWSERLHRPHPGTRWFVGSALALALAMTVLLHGKSLPFLRPDKDPLLRLRGWTGYAAAIAKLRAQYRPDYLLTNNYSNASELAFYLPDRPTVFVARRPEISDQFSFWPGYAPQPGQSAFFISNELDYQLPPSLKEDFSKIEVIDDFWREYHGKKIDEYKVWLLRK